MKLSVRLSTRIDAATMLHCARSAERAGLWGFWLPENPWEGSSSPAASAIGSVCPELHIGLGVVVVRLRHPGVFALDVAVADSFLKHPLRVGIGAGLRDSDRVVMGLPKQSGMALLREYIDTLRRLLAGESMPSWGPNGSGEVSFRRPSRSLPIMIGAVGPKTIRLAAQESDGIVFSLGSTDAYLASAMEVIDSVRGEQAFETICYRFFGGNLSRDERDAHLAPLVANFIVQIVENPQSATLLAGLDMSMSDLRHISSRLDDGEPAHRVISDDMINEMCTWGTAEECVNRLSQLEEMGITEVALGLGAWLPDIERGMLDIEKVAQIWNAR